MSAPPRVTLPARTELGLSGRPPRNARTFLHRQLPILAARYVRSMKRALAFLNDPKNPIDATWIKVFNSVADRVGHPRTSQQQVDATATSFSASVHEERVVTPAMATADSDALAYIERRVEALRAARDGDANR